MFMRPLKDNLKLSPFGTVFVVLDVIFGAWVMWAFPFFYGRRHFVGLTALVIVLYFVAERIQTRVGNRIPGFGTGDFFAVLAFVSLVLLTVAGFSFGDLVR